MSKPLVSVSWLLLALALPAKAGDLGTSAVFNGATQFRFMAAPRPGGIVYETGESAPILEAWDTVLFQGYCYDEDVSFEAARMLPDGQWSPWQPAYAKRFANGRFWAKAVFETKARGRLRLRARGGSLREASEVIVFSVEVFLSADREGKSSGEPATRAAQRPLVHVRSEWRAQPPRQAYVPHAPYRLTLHHSDTLQTRALADTLQEVRFIQDFHMNGRGWIDIGYHFLIDASGNIVEGRPEAVVGAHVGNENTGNVGIVMLGNYEPPQNDSVTQAQLDAFVALARFLASKYAVDPETLRGHRDYNSTDCPGAELYKLLPQLKKRMAAPPASVLAVALAPPRFD